MASITTNWITYQGTSARVKLTFDSTQNIPTNQSIVPYEAVAELSPTGYHRSGAYAVVEIGSSSERGSTKTIYNGTQMAKGSFTFNHNLDGSLSLTVKVTLNIQGDVVSAQTTYVLPTIPRGHTFVLDKTMLTSGQSVKLTATKNVSTYTSTIKYSNGITEGTLFDKSTANEWDISYATLSNGMASGLTRRILITCETYNGNELVQTSPLYIAVNTGNIVLSLYDDGSGDIGVTIGERATGGGFNVKGIEANFSEATKVVFKEETDAVIARTSGATIMNYEVHKVGNVVNAQMRFRTTSATNAGTDLFVGTINKWLPIVEPVGMTTYFGSSAIVCTIWKDGTVRCRVVGAQVYATAEVQCAISYITNE